MKKRSLPLVLLSLFGSALLQTGCYNHAQLYEGPRLRESEEGTLNYWGDRSVLKIVRVDGERLVLPSVSIWQDIWQDESYALLHLLPGEHTVFVCPPWGLYRSSVLGSERMAGAALAVGWEGTSDEQQDAIWNSIDGWLLRFVVEPGHRYQVGAEGTDSGTPGWVELELETVIIGPDTLIVERPKGWKSWTPYIVEGGTRERVSEIVSGGE